MDKNLLVIGGGIESVPGILTLKKWAKSNCK